MEWSERRGAERFGVAERNGPSDHFERTHALSESEGPGIPLSAFDETTKSKGGIMPVSCRGCPKTLTRAGGEKTEINEASTAARLDAAWHSF